MNVRRYVAANTRHALEMVRQAQGSDVLILSNRKVEGGVELVTATGDVEPGELERLGVRQVTNTPRGEPAAKVAAVAAIADRFSARVDSVDPITLLQQDLGALKTMFEQQLASLAWNDYQHQHPLRARLMRALGRLGVIPTIGRTLVAEVNETSDFDAAWGELIQVLSQRLRCFDDPIAAGGKFALCGATGVGKTNLIAKLAARHALRHGAETVAIISADDQRLGAHQQMRTFGRLLGIQIQTAHTAADLSLQLEGSIDKQLVLIDLPGNATQQAQLARHLAATRDAEQSVQIYLVAAATTDYLAQQRITRELLTLPLAGCCLTKLDETATLGSALSWLVESRVPLAYVSAGQQVPDDLESISNQEFVKRLLALGSDHPVPLQATQFEAAFAS
jgi:flagellar biosynthesis protein FlhF